MLLDAGVSGLLSVFTRPSVQNYRKSSCRDFRLSRRFPQSGGEFDHFAVGERADEFCDLVDMVQRLESIFFVHFFASHFDEFVTVRTVRK